MMPFLFSTYSNTPLNIIMDPGRQIWIINALERICDSFPHIFSRCRLLFKDHLLNSPPQKEIWRCQIRRSRRPIHWTSPTDPVVFELLLQLISSILLKPHLCCKQIYNNVFFYISNAYLACDQEEYPPIILLNYSSKNVYTWVRLSVLKKKTDRSLDPRALRPTHLDSKCFGSSSAASNEDLQPPNNAYCDGLPGHYF